MEGGESSVEDLTRAIKLHKENLVKALVDRARAYLALKKYEDAIADANSAINLNRSCGRAHLWKGTALYAINVYEDAKSSLQEGIPLAQLSEEEVSAYNLMISECERRIEEDTQGEPKKQKLKDTQSAPKKQKLLTGQKEDFGPPGPLVGAESFDLLEYTQGAPKKQKLKDTQGAQKKQKLKDTQRAPKKQKLTTCQKEDFGPSAPLVGDMPQLLIASKPDYYICRIDEGQDVVELLGNLGKKMKSCITVIGGVGKVTRANLGGRLYERLHTVVSAQGIITKSGDVKVNMCICSMTPPEERVVYAGLVGEGTLAEEFGVSMTLAITPEFYEA